MSNFPSIVPPAGFLGFPNGPVPGGIGSDDAGAHHPGPMRRGGGRFNNQRGPYDRRGPRFGSNSGRLSPRGMGGGTGSIAGMMGGRPGGAHWDATAQAVGPREAVQGRSLKSYEDLDAVAGGGAGELNY